MKSELQNKLFEKYPKLFIQKDLSIKQTCMCWGIECGSGWYKLIDMTCNMIYKYLEDKDLDFQFIQVKEKFGGLCLYYQGGDEYIGGVVWFAEYLSYEICEQCGSNNNVKQTKGWISTLCDICMKNHDR